MDQFSVVMKVGHSTCADEVSHTRQTEPGIEDSIRGTGFSILRCLTRLFEDEASWVLAYALVDSTHRFRREVKCPRDAPYSPEQVVAFEAMAKAAGEFLESLEFENGYSQPEADAV
jgi:hypothetical protein